MPAEFDFIDWLRRRQKPSALVQLPAGDDLAVVNWPAANLLLVGVDQVLDGVHFDSAVHSPRAIGRKVMNRNLSDCAAMACLPAAAVVAAGLPLGCSIDYAKELYLGMEEAGGQFGCEIIGGDTGSWPGKLALSVTILGRSAGIAPITRSGAKAGDQIYLTGKLGGSILGRHMTFRPRIDQARAIASRFTVTAMIDLSDGLSRDLAHICGQSHLAAHLESAKIPIHEDAIELFKRDGIPPLDHALNDGEDHELLFTSPNEIPADLATRIGIMAEGSAITLDNHPLPPRGWQHQL